MFKFIARLAVALLMASPANAKIITTFQETDTGGVTMSIEATGAFDASFDLKHLDYVFFDDVGDIANDVTLPNFNPNIFQPVSWVPIGNGISIQALGFDNDTNVPGDLDDFFLRFVGTNGQSAGDSLGGFNLLSSGPVEIRNLSFDMLNPGIYFATDSQAQAFGGIEIRVVELEPVPLPASAVMLGSGLLLLGAARARRGRRQAT